MGTLRGDNGGGERPQEGGGLPDLPPEWGTIIIPDDASALDAEGARVRRQFRRVALRERWRRRLHLRPKVTRLPDDDSPGLAIPLLIMIIAVIATMVSLFAVAWPGQQRQRPTQQPPAPAASPPATAHLSMTDAAGTQVRLRDLTPAVVLLVDGCACDALVSGTVGAVAASRPATVPADARLTVVVVAATVPGLPAGLDPAVPVRALADPNHSVRATVPSLGTERTRPAVVLLHRDATVQRALTTSAVADFQADLQRLW